MKKILVVIVALSLLFSCFISASAAGKEESTLKVAVLSPELQAKENEANDKYNKLLAFWAYEPLYVDDVIADFPDFYGGSYIDDNKNLIIQTTGQSKNYIGYFEDIIDLSNVNFEEVKYSYTELKSEHSTITKKMNRASEDELISSISGVGISFPNNSITLYVVSTSAKFAYEVKNAISAFENIEVITTSSKDTACATAVEPGTKIINSSHQRSIGFWAYDGNNNLGIITAPHGSISAGDTIKIGNLTFGTAGTPHYSGNTDAVFVRQTNTTDFTATRYNSGWGFNLKSNGYIALAVGSTTYSRGITSMCQSGTITDINYSTSTGLNSCVVTSAPCDNGDSGGMVAGGGTSSSRYIAGIMTAKQGGTNYVIYVKASNILSNLGVSVY
jgi:hypothetical protein